MPKSQHNEGARRSYSFSLRPVEYLAIGWLAIRAGHLNRSRAFQELIRNRMDKELGANWEEALAHKEEAA